VIIPFGEYAPDLPALGNTGAPTAKNVIPHAKGYKKFPRLSNYSSALTAYCRGAFSAMDTIGDVSSYTGDATKLYRLVGTTMTDSSKVGGYSCAADSYWEFAKYDNQAVATNFDDTMQVITLGGSQFADLGGSPPKARHISVVGDFLVVGNTFDSSDGNVPNRVRWPGIGTTTSWTISDTTQADFQDLQGNGGWLQAIVGTQERGVIFQERAIWLMTYVGSPVVFQLDKVEDARGAFAPRSVLSVGGMIPYLADDGFYIYSGGQSIPIGANKIDRTFLADLNDDYLHRVTAAAIPNDKVVIWSYPGSGSADGTPNKCLLYNWVSQRWCFAEFDHELIFRAMSVGVTLDGLDSIGYSNLDTVPFSLDSKVWMGGKLQLAGFDTSHRLSYFTGTALDATLETGEFQAIPGKRAEIINTTPLVDGGTHTVQVGTRETQAGTVSWGSASTENASGQCPVRSNARYHRGRVNITGDFNDAIGIEVADEDIKLVGSR
jgi:hypothetical protein